MLPIAKDPTPLNQRRFFDSPQQNEIETPCRKKQRYYDDDVPSPESSD
jgi:hypothetical protein